MRQSKTSEQQLSRRSGIRLSEQLQKRLVAHFGEEVTLPSRTYAGKHQRASFGWIWCARIKRNDLEIGSIFPMKQCVKAAGLDIRKMPGNWIMFDVIPTETTKTPNAKGKKR